MQNDTLPARQRLWRRMQAFSGVTTILFLLIVLAQISDPVSVPTPVLPEPVFRVRSARERLTAIAGRPIVTAAAESATPPATPPESAAAMAGGEAPEVAFESPLSAPIAPVAPASPLITTEYKFQEAAVAFMPATPADDGVQETATANFAIGQATREAVQFAMFLEGQQRETQVANTTIVTSYGALVVSTLTFLVSTYFGWQTARKAK
jgi:hypothetical protein